MYFIPFFKENICLSIIFIYIYFTNFLIDIQDNFITLSSWYVAMVGEGVYYPGSLHGSKQPGLPLVMEEHFQPTQWSGGIGPKAVREMGLLVEVC